jgi:putative ABC transport system permease protein
MSSMLFTSKLKEVAIRKVFGADQLTIIRQFYSRYAFFNLIAIIVGLPVAIYVGNLWLETFQYRIELTSPLFIKAGVYILVAGLLSVSYYLARVAFSNPVQFLRRD